MEKKFELTIDIEGSSDKRYDEVVDALDTLGSDVNFSFEEKEVVQIGKVLRVKFMVETEIDEDDLFDELDECGFDYDFSFAIDVWESQ